MQFYGKKEDMKKQEEDRQQMIITYYIQFNTGGCVPPSVTNFTSNLLCLYLLK